MFKHKNSDYRVPRREKLFRLVTVLGLLVALAVLLREMGETRESPAPVVEAAPVTDEVPENRFCSGRDAITEAIAAGGEIFIDCGSVMYPEDTFVIRTNTRITGTGEYSVAISGSHKLKTLFVVENGAALYLSDLRIIDSTDIAIHVKPGGTLWLYNCRFSGHRGRRGMAAAVWNQGGAVIISGCTFTQNIPVSGSLVLNSRNGYLNMGGSIFRQNSVDTPYSENNFVLQNYGTAQIIQGIFDNNQAAIASWSGSITIKDTLIKNHSGYYGGVEYHGLALHNDTGSVMKVENSQIIDNQDYQAYQSAAVVNKGELTLTNILFARNGETDCLNFSRVDSDLSMYCKNFGG